MRSVLGNQDWTSRKLKKIIGGLSQQIPSLTADRSTKKMPTINLTMIYIQIKPIL